MELFEKILVCCPTASAKNYCYPDWIEHITKFYYPNFQIYMADNTQDGGKNAQYLNDYFKKYFNIPDKFLAQHSGTDNIPNVIERMAVSHNMCRQYAIDNGYKYLIHVESDVFPPLDIIETLLFQRKKVIGGLYYRDLGIDRRLMAQRRIYRHYDNIMAENFTKEDDLHFVNGTVREIAHLGLGCVLIHHSVFNKIPFRFVKGETVHPDTYFAEDCFRNDVTIFAHTGMICRHENQSWGIYKLDYK